MFWYAAHTQECIRILRFTLPHTNWSQRYAIIIYSNPNCLVIFPVSFCVRMAWRLQSRWNGVVVKCNRRCCWPLTTLNILCTNALSRRMVCRSMCACAMCVCVMLHPHDGMSSVQSSVSQPNVESQLSRAVNCMKDTNRSTKVLQTSRARVSTAHQLIIVSQAGSQRAASKAYIE